MADPLQTTVQVQDVPEYLRDYRSAILNAAFGLVFNPAEGSFIRQQMPNATFYNPPSTAKPPATTAPPATGGGAAPETPTPEAPAPDTGIAAALSMGRGAVSQDRAAGQRKLLGYVWDEKTKTYIPEAYKGTVTMAGGGTLAEKYAEIRKAMPVGLMDLLDLNPDGGTDIGSYVTYPGRTNPFGDSKNPAVTSSYTIPKFSSPNITQYNRTPYIGSAPGSGITRGGGAGTPGPGGTPGPSGPPSGGTQFPGGIPGGSSSGIPQYDVPVYSAGLAGTTQETRGAGGYNPAQYATDKDATGLAALLGGKTAKTNIVGPIGPPSQNLIDFGDGAQLNAGLVQKALGPITVDGVPRARTPSEMTLSLAGLRDEIAAGGGDTSQIDALIKQNNQAYSSGAGTSPVGQSGSTASPPSVGQSLAASGKQLSYSSGGGSASGSPIPNAFLDAQSQAFQSAMEELKRLQEQGGSTGMAEGGSLAQFDIDDDGTVKNYRRGGAVRKADGGSPNLLGVGTPQTPSFGGIPNLFGQTAMPPLNPPPVYGGQRVLGYGQDYGQYTPGTGFTTSNLTNQALTGAGYLPSVFSVFKDEPSGRTYSAIEPQSDFGKGVSNLNYATDLANLFATMGGDFAAQVGQQGYQPSYLMSQMPGIRQMGFQSPISIANLSTPQLELPTGVTPGRTEVGEFGSGTAQQYMSPYQQAVTDAQTREAIRQAQMQKAGRGAAAVRAGAFGGSRQAIQEGLADEALQRQLADIQATGQQRAYESAQAQFERDRAASLASQQANLRAALEAQMANQQAGLTAGQANLQAGLATQQLGTQAGLEAAKASQAGDLATWQMQLDAIKQASAEQQQQRQYDFANRLAALQQAQSGAAGLAGLSGAMMGIPGQAQQLELQRLAALQQAGGAIDTKTQQALDLAYQDFINQQNYPYQQLNWLQGILSGVPIGMQAESVQFQRPASGGLTGLLTSGAGLLSNYLQKQ